MPEESYARDERPEEAPVSEARPGRRSRWDFTLMMLTVALLGSLGVQSFVGTLYVWWAETARPGWDQSAGYGAYVGWMNALAAPQLVALVVVMGLCVPKRLLARRALLGASAAMLGLGVVVWALTRSVAAGLGAYLAVSGLIQVAVVVLTLAGAPTLTYLSEGRIAKVGSGLLHLGFIVTALVIVALQRSPVLLAALLAAAALTVAGAAMSFRSRRIGSAE